MSGGSLQEFWNKGIRIHKPKVLRMDFLRQCRVVRLIVIFGKLIIIFFTDWRHWIPNYLHHVHCLDTICSILLGQKYCSSVRPPEWTLAKQGIFVFELRLPNSNFLLYCCKLLLRLSIYQIFLSVCMPMFSKAGNEMEAPHGRYMSKKK